jgi:hypothetical protein
MRKLRGIVKNLRVLVPAKFFLGTAAALVLTATSCKKDTNSGLGVQPGSDLLNARACDTTTLVTWTLKEDSLQTSQALTQYVLGTYWDPIFGKVNSSIYTQFTFPTNDVNLDFASGGNEALLSCDSIVMSFSYGTIYYGDTALPQTIKVYQMNGSMAVNIPYKSDTTFAVYPVPVGVKTIYPTPHDSTRMYLKGYPGPRAQGVQMRIPLDRSIGQLILDQSGKPALAGNPNFLQLIKGFYIRSETALTSPGSGAMLYLPFSDQFTGLTLYYKNANLPFALADSLSWTFGIDLNAARCEHFEHDYSVADPQIKQALILAKHAPPHASQPVVFVSCLSGLKTKIEFPYIANWAKNGAVAINGAELTVKAMPPFPGSNPFYTPVAELALVNIDSLGHEVIMVDNLEGTDYFGGFYDAVNGQYVFHLDRYMQQLITGKQKNNGLYLLSTSSATTANRVMLGGGNNGSGFKMNLRLTYTKLH